jgi:hypothetical protein
MHARSWIIIALGLGATAVLSGQPLQVGSLPPSPTIPVGGPAPSTVFDFTSHPVSSGVLDSVTFAYSGFPCPSAVKIKFFRPFGIGPRFLTERGPFDVTQAVQTVSLSPAVAVQTTDLIAITKLSDCGSPLAALGADALATFPGDIENDVIINFSNVTQGLTLSLLASGTRTPFGGVAAVIPVAYEGAGLSGSFFRTETQFSNPTGLPEQGWILYTVHVITGINPPTSYVPYALAPYETKTLDLRTLFGALPLGNLDLVPTTGQSPLVSVHVFDDLGLSGTFGFTAPDVLTSETLVTGDRGVLVGPSDLLNFRFNVGFRGIPSANLLITLRGAGGEILATKSQVARVLLQASAQDLLGVPLPPNATLIFEVTSGTAVVYGVTADNRTNDISYQLARKITTL